jgi:hypothetical protein
MRHSHESRLFSALLVLRAGCSIFRKLRADRGERWRKQQRASAKAAQRASESGLLRRLGELSSTCPSTTHLQPSHRLKCINRSQSAVGRERNSRPSLETASHRPPPQAGEELPLRLRVQRHRQRDERPSSPAPSRMVELPTDLRYLVTEILSTDGTLGTAAIELRSLAERTHRSSFALALEVVLPLLASSTSTVSRPALHLSL